MNQKKEFKHISFLITFLLIFSNFIDINGYTLKIEAKAKDTSNTLNFTVGKEEYKNFYGQIHAHTGEGSDGIGTFDEAYFYAKNHAKADFFALTDHSNWFDNADHSNIKDGSKSVKWDNMHAAADKYNENGKFVAMAAYEMSWTDDTGGYGHINTFNTAGFETKDNKKMNLPAYYAAISADTQSISQLNHPGNTLGDFNDFSYWTPQVDKVVSLIEVGNGEGPVRSLEYLPSYEYYTRALDKGWHVAPTNNGDNHKGKWVDSNTARTVIIAKNLTRDSIYEAMRLRRVYATEDNNLSISYKVNGQMMGSSLDKADGLLRFNIKVTDKDASDTIAKISIIANGGTVVKSKEFSSNDVSWDFDLASKYSYYYVRVDEKDKDIAVSAPVWTGK